MIERLAIAVALVLGASFGCSSDEPGPQPEERSEERTAESALEETPGGEDPGTGGGGCVDCACPRGTRCWVDGTCQPYVEFSPRAAPPLAPPCVCDSQCPAPSQCSDNPNEPNDYGYCVTP